MGFIRAYGEQYSGDPFRFRLPRVIRPPKKVRKAFKAIGRGIGKGVGLAASLVPGPVGAIASLVRGGGGREIQQEMAPEPAPVIALPPQQILPALAAPSFDEPEPEPEPEYNVDEDDVNYQNLLAFARAYGWAGDPKPSKLAKAGAPPSTHAAAKKQNRVQKRTGTADKRSGADKRRGKGSVGVKGGAGKVAGQVIGSIAQAAPDLIAAARGGGIFGMQEKGGKYSPADLARITGRHPSAFGMGHSRRRINPANVKALRRGIRRLEGFEKLVKSVRKAAGGLRGVVMAPAHGARSYSRARGHKAGCRCVACKGR